MKKIFSCAIILVIHSLVLHANGEIKKMDSIVFGAGCFWCVEAAFRLVEGVTDVSVGYTGGTTENPTYEAVCSGQTGHAEVAKIDFDTSRTSLAELMKVFLTIHDPTSLNKQGADVGTQYRSAIFVNSDEQLGAVKGLLKQAQASYRKPIVTDVSPLGTYYRAEPYHQRYFEKNPEAGYCQMVVAPKVRKVKQLLEK